MSLTIGHGPLAGKSSAPLNYDLVAASPPHQLFFEDYAPRVRAIVGGEVVLDTRGAKLLHETGILPRVYAPLEDYRSELLQRTDTSTHCPFKGDASYWTVQAGERGAQDALWAYEDPNPAAVWLRGFAALDPASVDAWLVEEDRVVGHLRDPYHRVDVHESSRPVEIEIAGSVVARSPRPKLLFETGLPVRVYVPPADIDPGAVVHGSGLRTICPYKGEASYWTVGGVQDAAWSYETPLPDALRVQAHLSFDEGKDGVRVQIA